MDMLSYQAVIGPDLIVRGEVRNGRQVLVLGMIDGSISAEHVIVRHGGRVHGTLIAETAEIEGEVQGNILVRKLIRIGATGAVRGDVRYGALAIAEGAELSAEVRNVPPSIAGDLSIAVKRGQSVRITTEDLTAIDPDTAADSLVFEVSRPTNGFVAHAAANAAPLERFTQSELVGNNLIFVHDGSPGPAASFDVVVTDHAGATSGKQQTVHVAVF